VLTIAISYDTQQSGGSCKTVVAEARTAARNSASTRWNWRAEAVLAVSLYDRRYGSALINGVHFI
jgi:hypothetical protein